MTLADLVPAARDEDTALIAKLRRQLEDALEQWGRESIVLEKVKVLVKAWRDGEPEGQRSASSTLRAIAELIERPR